MSQNISVSTAILLESYTQLGLERRVRRYEPIRDIMNSWDRDTQNALILQNSDTPRFDHDLEVSSVPKEAPGDMTVYMYHSQKPGKWNKRHITLLSSGQMFISKKAGTKTSEKDANSICHLSDFDIYTPTAQQLRKTLKPPKKHCHAIKSQQKTTMFLSTENFVHFFSTDDELIAERWYVAVQKWRSWYLVHMKGEGSKLPKTRTAEITAAIPIRPGTRGGPTTNHKVKLSIDESPYTIGSFAPLINSDRFGKSVSPTRAQVEGEYDSEEENRPRQIPFHLRNSFSFPDDGAINRRSSRRHPPPVSYKVPQIEIESEEEFMSSGLLGRSYSQRQKRLKEREAALDKAPSAFIEGPTLFNNLNNPVNTITSPRPSTGAGGGGSHQRSHSVRTTKTKRPETSSGPSDPNNSPGASGLQRGQSQRVKPKPLLEFTPTFREPPQWDKTGKGHGVKAVEGVPLVDIATRFDVGKGVDGPKDGTLFRRQTVKKNDGGEGAL